MLQRSSSSSLRAAVQRHATRGISTRVQGIGNNVFAEISMLAAQHGAVNLGQGFPSFHTPDFVKQAAIDAISGNHNQYTRPGGQPDYVRVLAELYSSLMQREIDPLSQIVTFNGAQEGIASIMAALVEPGDEVLIFEPYFDAYKTVATLHGITTVGVPFTLAPRKHAAFHRHHEHHNHATAFASQDFVVDLATLEARITPRTKMLVLNTPHNPTGKVFSREELEGICRVLRKHPHVLVLSDEVYEFMCFDGRHHERVATLDGMFHRTISLFSAGKTFSCTGWRVGYAVCPPHLAGAITKAHSTVPFCGVTPFEVALASCFQQMQTNGYVDHLRATLEGKRNRLVGALEAANWKPIVPEGGYFVCCNVTHLPIFQEFAHIQPRDDLAKPAFPDYQFAYKLCKEAKLAVIPTSPFFTKAEHLLSNGLVRLAYCKDEETLDAAIRIIEQLAK